jgi:hypothetical protein
VENAGGIISDEKLLIWIRNLLIWGVLKIKLTKPSARQADLKPEISWAFRVSDSMGVSRNLKDTLFLRCLGFVIVTCV